MARFKILGQGSLPLDVVFIDRLIDAYQSQKRDAVPVQNMEGHWSDLGWQGNLVPLDHALAQKDSAGLRNILERLFQSQCSYGIAMGKEELNNILSAKSAVELYERQWMESLILLAEALGSIPVENIEASPLARRFHAGDLLQRSEKILGIPITFPQHFGAFGCAVDGNIIPKITFFHILAAWMCSQLLTSKRTNPVVEIGGGFGGLFHFLCRLTNFNYVAFDVPAALAMQAAIVAVSSPQITIQLYGEKLDFLTHNRATFLPSWTLLRDGVDSLSFGGADLIINQDTLAELDTQWATAIMSQLSNRLTGPLISIGPDISISKAGDSSLRRLLLSTKLRLHDRVPFQVRPGYMREIYLRNDTL